MTSEQVQEIAKELQIIFDKNMEDLRELAKTKGIDDICLSEWAESILVNVIYGETE
jgi:hypothetical protein